MRNIVRRQPIVVVGQTAGLRGRPVLFLPKGTAGFSNTATAKPILLFETNWCLAPGASESTIATGCNSSAQIKDDWKTSAYQFNQVLQGVDIHIGAHNPGAIGVDMNAAQGSTVPHACPTCTSCMHGYPHVHTHVHTHGMHVCAWTVAISRSHMSTRVPTNMRACMPAPHTDASACAPACTSQRM